MSTCDVFNCLFPLDVQNEIAIRSLLLLMASLFIGFLVEKTSLVKVGNPISDCLQVTKTEKLRQKEFSAT